MTEFDAIYDLVVIGGGGSGLSAAVQAAQNGLSVALLEKEDKTGGSSSFAEGHAAFESEEQKKRGIDVKKSEAFNTIMNYSHWNANPKLVSRFVANAATTIEKMKDVGAVYERVDITAPDQPEELTTWHLPEGEVAHVIELLEADARRRGVDIFMQTSATKLVTESGKVSGVVAKDSDGQDVSLGAKAVIVATGGYAGDPELMNKYGKHPIGEAVINAGGPGNTGDGIRLVLDAGGTENSNIGTQLLFPLMREKSITSQTNNAGMQPYLWLNADGKRFVNEIVGLNFGNAGDVVASLPGHFYWLILSKETVDHLVNDGNEVGLGIYVENYEKLVNLPDEIQADVADESRTNVVGADSIEDLALKMGLNPQVVREQVDRYNEIVAKGEDTDFYKESRFLFPIKEAPFYGIKMETGIMVTMGALEVDENLRALDANREPIPGLYIVGCDAGGMWGEAYCLPVPGNANGFALTSGWLAADDIKARIDSGELA